MIYLACALSIVAFILSVMAIRMRNQLEHILITKHRDFMRGLKVNWRGRPIQDWSYNRKNEHLFSAEVDGRPIRYDAILKDRMILSRLGDGEVNNLCSRYLDGRKRATIVALLASIAWFAVLA